MDGQTDNQQCKASDTDIAWLAGFIDGEGSIGLKVQKYSRGKQVFYVAPYIQVVNTHIATLEPVHRILKGMGAGVYVNWPRPRKVPGGVREISDYKPLWRILVNGLKRCKPVLTALGPYLITKLDDANLVMEFIESREASHYRHLPYTTRELEIVNRFRRKRRSGKAAEAVSPESLNDYTQETPTEGVKV